MSDESYEIRCPVCKSAVPSDAPRCPTCAANAAAAARAASANVSAVSSPMLSAATAPALNDSSPQGSLAAAGTLEGATTLKLKDYHQMVRANYGSVQGRGAAATFGNPIVPILLILAIGLAIGAAIAFHWL